ncbi:MAG: KdsC family phosphatase [Vicinamibacterales bacterium]
MIVYDFDGVMTDNRVLVNEDGVESVFVNRSDGLAVSIIKKHGIPQLILSTEENKVVAARARKLGIPVLQAIADKAGTLSAYCAEHGYGLPEVLFVGNDINDEPAMRLVGFGVCPSDAADEIKAIATLVVGAAGGYGALRELLRHLDFSSGGGKATFHG